MEGFEQGEGGGVGGGSDVSKFSVEMPLWPLCGDRIRTDPEWQQKAEQWTLKPGVSSEQKRHGIAEDETVLSRPLASVVGQGSFW